MRGLVPYNPSTAPVDNRPMKRWALVEPSGAFVIIPGRDAPADPGEWEAIADDVQLGFVKVNGKWVDPSKTADVVRARRDAELLRADRLIWPYLDRGETPPPELAAYKQALRDVPEQPGFPANVTWPQAPAQ